jgi:predicted nuclease of predicted toxin-antitoxin system
LKFLIDNALPPRLARLLTQAGQEAAHVRDYGMQAAEDVDILSKARSEEQVLVSADSDFAALLALQDASQPSFILFRETDTVSAEQYATQILANLPLLETSLNRGCVAVFRGGRIRVRSLPISADVRD